MGCGPGRSIRTARSHATKGSRADRARVAVRNLRHSPSARCPNDKLAWLRSVMDRRRLSFVLLTALLTAAPVVPVRAHDVPLEVVTFVSVEGPRLLVLARVPIALLADAHLPSRPDGFLDLQAIDGPLRAVAGDVARNLDVMAGERPLPLPSAAWAVLPRPDASFDTYEAALARFAAPRAPVDRSANIDPSKGLLDLRFEYRTAPAGRF